MAAFKELLKRRTQQEQTTILANYLPNDPLWNDKNIEDSPTRKILLGLSKQWIEFRENINQVCEEYDPRKTTNLIEQWEAMVGIPDSCISNTVSLEQRRKQILLKLAGINASTTERLMIFFII